MSAVSATRSGRDSLLARMTRILDVFDDPNADLSLDQIARRSGLPRSSTHRIIVEMIELDWLTRWGRNFRLGPVRSAPSDHRPPTPASGWARAGCSRNSSCVPEW
ncbi:helix-turn-helix domain-containing protein [Rhodococcus hoagii]|nr:helix-turn-helix domain-containing protein [Prescottella equi]